MAVKTYQGPFGFGLRSSFRPARLCRGSWIESEVGRTLEAIIGRSIVKEWWRRVPHCKDRKLVASTRRKGEECWMLECDCQLSLGREK